MAKTRIKIVSVEYNKNAPESRVVMHHCDTLPQARKWMRQNQIAYAPSGYITGEYVAVRIPDDGESDTAWSTDIGCAVARVPMMRGGF